MDIQVNKGNKLFDINNHIVQISDKKIEAIVKPALVFFEGTPYYQLTNLPKFTGAGVYAIFLKSTDKTYKDYLPCMHPIYVGKAVPSGSRQGKATGMNAVLKNRLQKHLRSIKQVGNLENENFLCRFIILQGQATEMISTMESCLIRKYNPLWNSYIDGFGINAPGKGRRNQSPSEWDILHPGRYYANKLTGKPKKLDDIMNKIKNYSVQKKRKSLC